MYEARLYTIPATIPTNIRLGIIRECLKKEEREMK